MKIETRVHRRYVTIRIIEADRARLSRKWEDLPDNASVLLVRLKEADNMDHEAECIYDNRCTHQDLAALIGAQVQRILDAHDRGSE